MRYTTEHIAHALKEARKSKGLSQRELSKKAGVPQGHISKIENGAVDLRLSSLVALARVLDLELTLVPRKAVPAVKSIVRSTERHAGRGGDDRSVALKELNRLQNTIASVTQVHPAVEELAQLHRQVRDQIQELQRFQLPIPEIEAVREINKTLQAIKDNTKGLDAIRQTLSRLQNVRNALVHTSVNVPQIKTVRPAYSLDEDDHG